MTTNPTRHRRLRLAGACAMTLALAAGAIALPAAPAHAADPITAAEQPHFAYYHLDQARAKGYTGKGVTIALIDGEVDTSAPELAGATVIDKTPCTVTSGANSKSHGTAMASLLVSKEYGVAPDATLLAYRTSFPKDGDKAESDCRGHHGNSLYEPEWLINQAITDGAQIISISATSGDTSDAVKWAIARANALGVIVVSGAGNDNEEDTIDTFGKWSGVVSVSAIDTSGKRAEYSSWGKGVTVAAVGGPMIAHNYENNTNISTRGTSNATPLVAGFLALAKQKWPNATSNQLLQLLTKTALNNEGQWNKYTGMESPPSARCLTPIRPSTPTRTQSWTRATPAWAPPTRNPSNTSPALLTPETSLETPPTLTEASTKASYGTPTPPYPCTWAPAPATTPNDD